jgi:hypothetical protein
MEQCDYCGKQAGGKNLLQIGGKKFCDNICRHSFEMNGNKSKAGPVISQEPIKSKKKNTKIILLVSLVVGVIVAAIVGSAVYHKAIQLFKANITNAKVLSQVASKMNQTLPMMLDAETELSTTIGLDGKLEYHYRLVNYTAEQIDTAILMPKLRANSINGSCSKKETRILLNNGVVLESVYYDKNRKEISRFSLDKLQCVNAGL